MHFTPAPRAVARVGMKVGVPDARLRAAGQRANPDAIAVLAETV